MTDARPPIIPVVLSGGAGTRLWPASRERQPKQLLSLVDRRSMIHATIDRLAAIDASPPIVVANVDQVTAVRRTLRNGGISNATIILEPIGRNTAPAVAVAAWEALRTREDALLLVLPADHAITDEPAFARAVNRAVGPAADGLLVTFGITPEHPETGYGYIRSGDVVDGEIRTIAEFKEKPDLATATRYLASGDYSWNSGMFLLAAKTYLDELQRFRPDMAAIAHAAHAAASREGDVVALHGETFATCPAESIDFAVMENTAVGAVLPMDPGWSDVGSWASLWGIADQDEFGNVVLGDVVTVDTTASYVRGTADRLVAVVGLDGVIVVDTRDAVLVSTKDGSQEVKRVVDDLRRDGRIEAESDGTTYADWGVIRLFSSAPGHSAHVFSIDPASEVAMAETGETETFWQVLEGVARITVGQSVHDATPGTTIHVPPQQAAHIANAADEVLRLMRIVVDKVVSPEDLERIRSGEESAT